MPHPDIVTALQLAVGPVILISAVGLLLLTLNNRLAASINRARVLRAERASEKYAHEQHTIDQQIQIIWHRAQLLRASIEWMSGSALLSSMLVICLFVQAVGRLYIPYLAPALFVASLSCIIVGLSYFIYETRQALAALGLELRGTSDTDA